MESIVSDFLIKAGGSAWIGVGLLALLWAVKEPLSALLKTRELRQKDREILLAMLKESGLLSDVARATLSEGLEREEFARYTGASLTPTERMLLAALVKENESLVRWSDIKRVLPHLKLRNDRVLELKLTFLQKALYWISRLFTTFLLLVAITGLIFGGYAAVFQNQPKNIWLAYGFIYLFLAFFTRATWVLPHESYKKLKPMFPLGVEPESANSQLQPTDLASGESGG